ncbi:MAG: LuxR C-terminal-related transcriptional regulator [Dehalococcoidia bacterium]
MDERPSADTAPAIALSDSEQRLLDHIRAGLVDAEIAVRLGVSHGEVKAGTERLAAKLRVRGRDELRAAPQREESTPEPHKRASRYNQLACFCPAARCNRRPRTRIRRRHPPRLPG